MYIDDAVIEITETECNGYIIKKNGEKWEVVETGELFNTSQDAKRYIKNGFKKTSAAQRKAVYNYDDNFERVNCRFTKGTKERIKKIGYKSVNDYIKLAVMEKLEHDEKILI